MNELLIAPCGMNCGICLANLRDKNRCYGCRVVTNDKAKSRILCRIKNCNYLKNTKSGFCYDCMKYPCTRLKQLDKRYRTKYGMSMIENLERMKMIGLDNFISEEVLRWKCKKCGATLCIHRYNCLVCNSVRPK